MGGVGDDVFFCSNLGFVMLALPRHIWRIVYIHFDGMDGVVEAIRSEVLWMDDDMA